MRRFLMIAIALLCGACAMPEAVPSEFTTEVESEWYVNGEMQDLWTCVALASVPEGATPLTFWATAGDVDNAAGLAIGYWMIQQYRTVQPEDVACVGGTVGLDPFDTGGGDVVIDPGSGFEPSHVVYYIECTRWEHLLFTSHKVTRKSAYSAWTCETAADMCWSDLAQTIRDRAGLPGKTTMAWCTMADDPNVAGQLIPGEDFP